jgi:hypothetical protein
MYERKADQAMAITPAEYGGLQEAYDHFNRELFDSELPDVFITYQRKANLLGYFGADRFSGRVAQFDRHELALNPDGFISKSDQEICSTLTSRRMSVGSSSAALISRRSWASLKANGLLMPRRAPTAGSWTCARPG